MSAGFLDDWADGIRNRKFDHIVFWLGSIFSARGPSACADVWQIRDELIVDSLLQRVRGFTTNEIDSATREELLTLLPRLRSRPLISESSGSAREDGLRSAVERIPFERFMTCLADAEDGGSTAIDVIRLACRCDAEPKPSGLHGLFADLIRQALDTELTKRVTVVTSNYDMLLEAALGDTPSCGGGSTANGSWVPIEGVPDHLSASRHRRYGDHLQLLKVHGSIDRPTSLVFTAAGLANGMLTPSWFEPAYELLVPASAFIFAGYGFNDPDLRTLIRRLLVPGRGQTPPCAIRLERSMASAIDSRRGMDVLRQEFLESTRIETLPCDLFHPTAPGEHFFLGMMKRLGCIARQSALPTEGERWERELAMAAASDPFSAFTPNATVEFAARLCDAANSVDARSVIGRLVMESDDSKRRPERVTLYHRSITGNSAYKEHVQACRTMRSKWADPETVALTYAFEAFSYTIGLVQPGTAMRLLKEGRRQVRGVADPIARMRFQHYDCHFWVKALQRLDLAVDRDSHRWGFRKVVRPWAQRLVRRLANAAEGARKVKDVQFLAEIRDLEAQTHIYTGQLDEAIKVATECQEYYSSMGLLNGMALVDRTLGWIWLARRDQLQAIRAFARGLYRAIRSVDRSLMPKLSANLLRVLAAVTAIDLRSLTGRPFDVDAVAASSRMLAVISSRDQLSSGDGENIWPILGEFYQGASRAELVAHLLRFDRVDKYPIYHPPRP